MDGSSHHMELGNGNGKTRAFDVLIRPRLRGRKRRHDWSAADHVRATLRNENSCPPEAVSTPFYIESDRPSERGIAISTIRIWLD